MYELPNVNHFCSEEEFVSIFQEWDLKLESFSSLGKHKHVFTHIDWKMNGYAVKVRNSNAEFLWVNLSDLKENYAIPTAFKPFLKKCIEKAR